MADISLRRTDVEKCKLEPLEDRLVVVCDQPPTKTKGGILLPEDDPDDPDRGLVVAVGPGYRTDDGVLVPCEVKVGQKVCFPIHVGTDVEFDEKKYRILRERDVTAVVL